MGIMCCRINKVEGNAAETQQLFLENEPKPSLIPFSQKQASLFDLKRIPSSQPGSRDLNKNYSVDARVIPNSDYYKNNSDNGATFQRGFKPNIGPKKLLNGFAGLPDPQPYEPVMESSRCLRKIEENMIMKDEVVCENTKRKKMVSKNPAERRCVPSNYVNSRYKNIKSRYMNFSKQAEEKMVNFTVSVPQISEPDIAQTERNLMLTDQKQDDCAINIIQNRHMKRSRNGFPSSGPNYFSLTRNSRIGNQSWRREKTELQASPIDPLKKKNPLKRSQIPKLYKEINKEIPVKGSNPIHIQLKLSDMVSRAVKRKPA